MTHPTISVPARRLEGVPRPVTPAVACQIIGLAVLAVGGLIGVGSLFAGLAGRGPLGLPDVDAIRTGTAVLVLTILAAAGCLLASLALRGREG